MRRIGTPHRLATAVLGVLLAAGSAAPVFAQQQQDDDDDKRKARKEQRQEARAAKDWKQSDVLRDQIAALGWVVKDTKEGPKLTPA